MGKDFIMDFTTQAMMSELSRECFNGNNEELFDLLIGGVVKVYKETGTLVPD